MNGKALLACADSRAGALLQLTLVGSTMPVTLTFDIEQASIADPNDRQRISACFRRLGWEHIGGSAWRYPELDPNKHASEDWFNHVIPALMYFRSLVEHSGMNVTKFTLDAHSAAGFRSEGDVGSPIQDAGDIVMYDDDSAALSEARLRQFLEDAADSLE